MENQANLDDLAGLTPEERAALAEGDAPAAVEQEQTAAEQVELRNDPTPILQAQAPANAADTLQRCAAFEAQVQQQLQDGEITSSQYRDAISRAAEVRDNIRWGQRKAELAGDMKRQAEDNQWNRAVQSFMSGPAAHIAKSRAGMVAFDEHVKAVTGDTANAHLSDRAQLEKALRLFNADVGGALGLKQRAAAYDAMAGQNGGQSVGNADFAALDRLASSDPMAYERAVGKLSPDEQDAYANFAG